VLGDSGCCELHYTPVIDRSGVMEGADWDPIVHRVLAGNVPVEDLPEVPQRVVRVFLSSTGVGELRKSCVIVHVLTETKQHIFDKCII